MTFPSPIALGLETLFRSPGLLREEGSERTTATGSHPTSRGPSRSTSTDLSWIDSFRRAEFLAEGTQIAPVEHLTSDTTSLLQLRSSALAMISSPNIDAATAFVSPEANSRPACCPNAPTKKSKSLRRRPDEENDAEANVQLPVARKLAF